MRDHPTIKVSPPVRSASYYSEHEAERDMVARLCLFSRLADASWPACINVARAVGFDPLLPSYMGCPIPVC